MTGVPIVLARTKIDLIDAAPLAAPADESDYLHRKGPSVRWEASRTISWEEGEAYAKKIGAVRHMPCSALTGEGVKELFDEILLIGNQYRSTNPEGAPRAKWQYYDDALRGRPVEEIEWEDEKPRGRCFIS